MKNANKIYGIRKKISTSIYSGIGRSYNPGPDKPAYRDTNPDPYIFNVLRMCQVGNHLVVEIRYLNCTNYEGKKILLYDHLSPNQFMSFKSVDPHFSDNTDYKSPIARFEPTDRGWRMAVLMAHTIIPNANK